MSRYLTDAIVEDAASMAFENSMRFYGARWPDQGESIKEAWRRSMRTLLGRVAEQIGAEVAKDLGPRPSIQVTITNPPESERVPIVLPCRRCGHRP